MELPFHGLLILLYFPGGSTLPHRPFQLRIFHQTGMETPFPEFHLSRDAGPDLLGPADVQHLCHYDVDKDKGYLIFPTMVKDPPPLLCQYLLELTPHRSRGRGLPDGRLHGQPEPTTLPHSVVQNPPDHVINL